MAKSPEPPPVPPSAGDQLLGLLGRVTAEDLAAVDAQLDAKRAEIESLKAVRQLMAARLGVKEERKKPGPRAAKLAGGTPDAGASDRGAMMAERRTRIARLLGTRGPLMPMAIASECEIPSGSITSVLTCEWFERTAQGVRLTATGRREALGLST